MASFELPYLSSGTFIVPATGWYSLYAGGPGGPGSSDFTASSRRAGGSGAYVIKRAYLTIGDRLDIIIGAGNTGLGTTTIFGPSIAMEAKGGEGGVGNSTVGAKGGIGSGGDININGIDAPASQTGGMPFPLFGTQNYTAGSGGNGWSPIPAGVVLVPPGYSDGATMKGLLEIQGVASGSTSNKPGVGGSSSNLAGGPFAGGFSPSNNSTGQQVLAGAGGLGSGAGGGYFSGVGQRAFGGSGFALIKWRL